MTEGSWPELGEELARKSLDSLHRALHAHMVDKTMTERDVRLVINTIVDVAQGLVPNEVIDIALNVREELGK